MKPFKNYPLLIVVALASLLVFTVNSHVLMGAPAATAAQQKVVVHLSHYSDDLHRVAMALKLATAMQSQGAQVTLLLDVEGVRLADARQPQELSWGFKDMPTVAEQYDAFIEAGGEVLVCPMCAKAAGLDAASLRPGARLGMMDAEHGSELAEVILAADKVLDY